MTTLNSYAGAMDDLVVSARTNHEAFGALYDRFFPMVHRYCRRRLFDATVTDDVASEVFLQVARAMPTFPGKTEEDFRRWVYRIATNGVNAHLRQAARHGELLQRAASSGWWTKGQSVAGFPDSSPELWESAARALAQLTAREQSVLTLRFMEGLSYEEVADILGVRTSTLRVVASRALRNLRARLAGHLGSPAAKNPDRLQS